jgi:hypothetical protein
VQRCERPTVNRRFFTGSLPDFYLHPGNPLLGYLLHHEIVSIAIYFIERVQITLPCDQRPDRTLLFMARRSINEDSPTFNTAGEHTSAGCFPADTWLATPDEEQRFELLRLASFALRLRGLEERWQQKVPRRRSEMQRQAFQRCLLQHAIFQQVVALIRLNAREEAFQILSACRL